MSVIVGWCSGPLHQVTWLQRHHWRGHLSSSSVESSKSCTVSCQTYAGYFVGADLRVCSGYGRNSISFLSKFFSHHALPLPSFSHAPEATQSPSGLFNPFQWHFLMAMGPVPDWHGSSASTPYSLACFRACLQHSAPARNQFRMGPWVGFSRFSTFTLNLDTLESKVNIYMAMEWQRKWIGKCCGRRDIGKLAGLPIGTQRKKGFF